MNEQRHVTGVVKIVQYEAYCENCDWTETWAAGDLDAGSNQAARLKAIRAAREHVSAERVKVRT